MAETDKKASNPLKGKDCSRRLLLLALLFIALVGLGAVILNAPMPAPKTVNEVHTWPVPKQNMIDLLKSDWFKEALHQPAQSALSAEQISNALLGCWRYRNGRLSTFEGSFTIRSVDPAAHTIKGYWNYDKGHALPLQGEYKIDAEKQVLISLSNTSGTAFGRDLILRQNRSIPCLCAAKSDPYAGLDFRALKTSTQMRPTAPTLTESLQPVTISLLVGRWHPAKVADKADKPSFEIDRVFDDGSFSIKDAPDDGGFIGDEDAVSIYVGDQAYNQLSVGQTGAEITLNSDETPIFAKEPGQTPLTGQSGSVLSGLYNLIQQHNHP